MARYTGPKLKQSRRVGVPIVDTPKHTSKRALTFPGMHGFRGRRMRDYGIRLVEKQKLKFHYGVLERQFRRYMTLAGSMPGNSGDMLLQVMETRLDNVVRRAGLARTIWGARQLVAHGQVKVNGRKTDRPSALCKVGDTITLSATGQKLAKDAMDSLAGYEVPGWLDLNPSEFKLKVVAKPTTDQIPFDVNTNLIIEFYR